MSMEPVNAGPIAIGGVGGSGTRIVASFIESLGVYLGERLNPVMDNLWFTLLFKRRSWARSFPDEQALQRTIATFVRLMEGQPRERMDTGRIVASALECALVGHNMKGSGRGPWALSVGRSMIQSDVTPGLQWGWKEPNTHVFLGSLARTVPQLRYIHLIRDGVVMVDSKNWDQPGLWAQHYDLSMSDAGRPSTGHTLKYWVRANQAAVQVGTSALEERFFLVRFEDLISDPSIVLGGLADSLGLDMTPDAERVIASVRSSSRQRSNGLSLDQSFDDEVARGLRNLGYSPP